MGMTTEGTTPHAPPDAEDGRPGGARPPGGSGRGEPREGAWRDANPYLPRRRCALLTVHAMSICSRSHAAVDVRLDGRRGAPSAAIITSRPSKEAHHASANIVPGGMPKCLT